MTVDHAQHEPKPVVRGGRNPLAISLLLVFLVSGVAGFVHPSGASPTLTAVLGHWVWTWHVGLLVGTVTSLVGVMVLRPLNDVLVERVGMIWMATLFLAYGVAVCALDEAFFTTYSGVILGLGAAFAARAWQITRDLQRLRQILRDMPRG